MCYYCNCCIATYCKCVAVHKPAPMITCAAASRYTTAHNTTSHPCVMTPKNSYISIYFVSAVIWLICKSVFCLITANCKSDTEFICNSVVAPSALCFVQFIFAFAILVQSVQQQCNKWAIIAINRQWQQWQQKRRLLVMVSDGGRLTGGGRWWKIGGGICAMLLHLRIYLIKSCFVFAS